MEVGAYGIVYLADADKLVGGVGAGGLAGTQLEGWPGHESLVAEGGGAEGLLAHGDALLNKRMALRDG